MKQPIFIPRDSVLARHIFKYCHGGVVAATINKVRHRYWVPKLRSSISCDCTYCKKYRLTIPKCSTHLSLTKVHNRILLTCASTRAVGWILREDDWHSEEHSFYSNWSSIVEIWRAWRGFVRCGIIPEQPTPSLHGKRFETKVITSDLLLRGQPVPYL